MRWRPLLVGASALGLASTACSHSAATAGQFCAAIRHDQVTITTAVRDPAAVKAVVGRFQDLGRAAPLAIKDDWGELTSLVQQAAALAPDDTAGRNALVLRAYEANAAVQNVVGWVKGVCGVDLGGAPAPTVVLPRAPATTAAAKPEATGPTTTAPTTAVPSTTTPPTTATGRSRVTSAADTNKAGTRGSATTSNP